MMLDFLERLFGRSGSKSSSSTAKERLQFVLIHDRINIAPEKMEEMKREILGVIAKYVTIDGDQVEIALENRNRLNMLVAEVPFLGALDSPIDADNLDEDDDLADNSPPSSISPDQQSDSAP